MWPFRRQPDLLEQQRRELERERERRARNERRAGAEAGWPPAPPWTKIDGGENVNSHGTGVRFSIRSRGDGPAAPEPPDADPFPPGMTVHEFSGTPGTVAGQLGRALLRALVGRPRRP